MMPTINSATAPNPTIKTERDTAPRYLVALGEIALLTITIVAASALQAPQVASGRILPNSIGK
jgi:hypothetical protein